MSAWGAGNWLIFGVTLLTGLVVMPLVFTFLVGLLARRLPGSARLWGNVALAFGVTFAVIAAVYYAMPAENGPPLPLHDSITISW